MGLSELIANRDPLIWDVYTKLHGIPEEELATLNTPEKIVLTSGVRPSGLCSP